MKVLLSGQSVDFQGTSGRLGFATERRLPVLMAASGPKAIELAGEIADGVLLLVGFTPEIVQVVTE
jgi:5,10-methylenetetrahydromethanopterin reductase